MRPPAQSTTEQLPSQSVSLKPQHNSSRLLSVKQGELHEGRHRRGVQGCVSTAVAAAAEAAAAVHASSSSLQVVNGTQALRS